MAGAASPFGAGPAAASGWAWSPASCWRPQGLAWILALSDTAGSLLAQVAAVLGRLPSLGIPIGRLAAAMRHRNVRVEKELTLDALLQDLGL